MAVAQGGRHPELAYRIAKVAGHPLSEGHASLPLQLPPLIQVGLVFLRETVVKGGRGRTGFERVFRGCGSVVGAGAMMATDKG